MKKNTLVFAGICCLALLTEAACSADRITSPLRPTTRARASISAEPPEGPLATAYSQAFVRHAGPPDNYTVSLDLSHYEGDFVMTVTNGDGSGANRVEAGSVTVDGARLLENADLAKSQLSHSFTFATTPERLAITVLGTPNGYLRVEIKGHERRWRVCPGENYYRTYPTVQEAVAAADAGATIWVCDGVHYAAAVVDKPLTIRPEHSGAATLRDTLVWSADETSPNAGGPAPIFWVQGLTEGTFRVVDFDMVLHQSALAATDKWTRVEMDSVRITSVDSAHTTAVRSLPSTGNDGVLELTRSSVTGAATGIIAAGGIVNVSEAEFGLDGQPVLYTGLAAQPLTAATGVVSNSTFNSCNLGGCIRIVARGGVTVSGNTVNKPAGSPVGAAVQVRQNFQLGVPQLPIVIEDNVFTGAPSATPTLIETWTLARGLQILNGEPTFPPGSITFVRNTITNAGAGIAINSLNGTSLDAHDNTITNNYAAVSINNSSGPGAFFIPNLNLHFNRNDVINTTVGFFWAPGIVGTVDLTCNWWGAATGLAHVDVRVPLTVYSPWAMETIAGRPEVACP